MSNDTPWWHDRDNLAAVAYWMACNQYSAKEVARMIAKPWNYDDLWARYEEAA
jgi:hypothetical protein